ncbi:MAG: hypothetical protein KAU50_04175 [Candidatus Marinimicrobia bacterium]|nr:hypothetical protein [Candidatus Neomarinimicrobiota bacterium]
MTLGISERLFIYGQLIPVARERWQCIFTGVGIRGQLNMHGISRISAIILSLFLVSTCDEPKKDDQPNWGSLDFTRMVALGNSLTAGVSDAALYEAAQLNSFPLLIARKAGVGDAFEQPIMSGNGFSWSDDAGRFSINPISFSFSFLDPGQEANRDLDRPYNNLGIPMLTAGQLYTATTSAEAQNNHFVDKILRSQGRIPIEEALALDPTLITLWIGNNDVLGAASLGLASSAQPYTPADEFATHFDSILTLLTDGTEAPIFLANVVDLTTVPYFSTLPTSVVDTLGEKHYLYGVCESGVRQLTDNDLLLYWALPTYFIAQAAASHGSFPVMSTALNDTVVLDSTERAEIQALIADYNTIVALKAAADDQINLVDTYNLYQDLAIAGYQLGTGIYTVDLLTFDDQGAFVLNLANTLFSIDGLHPNRFGYAAIADAFIAAMNAAGGAEIPPLEIEDLN